LWPDLSGVEKDQPQHGFLPAKPALSFGGDQVFPGEFYLNFLGRTHLISGGICLTYALHSEASGAD